MPRRYTLRLGDGTILSVDQAGLNTWRADTRAMVQAAGGQWRPLRDLLAMQEAAAKHDQRMDPSLPAPPPVLPLVPPRPRDARPVAEAAPSEPAAPQLATDESPPILSAEPVEATAPIPDVSPRERTAPEEPPAAEADEAPVPEAWADEPEPPPAAPAPEPTPRDEEVWEPEPSQWADAIEPPAFAEPPSPFVEPPMVERPLPTASPAVLSIADDPGVSTWSPPPRDDRAGPTTREAAGTTRHEPEPDDDHLFERRPKPIVIDDRVVGAFGALGGLLSRALDLLDRLYRPLHPKVLAALAWRPDVAGLRAKLSAARASFRARAELRPAPVESPKLQPLADDIPETRDPDRRPPEVAAEVPVIRLKPPDDEAAPLRAAQRFFRGLGGRAAVWTLGLRDGISRLARQLRPAPKPRDAPTAPVASSPAFEPPRREPIPAPPAISELPVIRLAKIEEPAPEEDVFQGGDENVFPAVRLWTKRIFWTGVLVGGALLAVRNWETWFPRAERAAGAAFTEASSFAEARERRVRVQRALQESTVQLPHLAPETIRLVMSRSAAGVLDPAEVFQATADAADLGLASLTLEERDELAALRRQLADSLTPSERDRLRDYDGVRGRRPPFAFEDQSAMELYARAARALPAESRMRLQALFAKAVTMGLSRSPGEPDRP